MLIFHLKKYKYNYNMIPNIVHYIFGLKEQNEDFLFVYYIAVYSCYLINNPENIFFYYHYEPYGKWWNELKKIPSITFKKVNIPNKFKNFDIIHTAHKADILRMIFLKNIGGIYLDIDTICVKPWKDLLKYKVVLGLETEKRICNAIMFTEKNSEFFKKWVYNYEFFFNPNGWGEASLDLPFLLYNENKELVELKDSSYFFSPLYNEINKIFDEENNIPENLITLHLWESYSINAIHKINDWSWAYDENNSKTLYGKLLLNILNNYINENNFIL